MIYALNVFQVKGKINLHKENCEIKTDLGYLF